MIFPMAIEIALPRRIPEEAVDVGGHAFVFREQRGGVLFLPELLRQPRQGPAVYGIQTISFNGVLLESPGLLVVSRHVPPLRAVVVGLEVGGLLAIFVGNLDGIVRTQLQQSIVVAVAPLDFQNGDLRRALGANLCSDPANPRSNGVCGGNFTAPLMVPTTEGGTIQAQQNMVFDPTTGDPGGSG
jgi:hypothetical protein